MLRFLQHENIMYIFIAGTDYDASRLLRLAYVCTTCVPAAEIIVSANLWRRKIDVQFNLWREGAALAKAALNVK